MQEAVRAIGSQIRRLRLARNWSQEQLAEQADLAFTYIGNIERGEANPTISVLLRIAEALEVSIGQLFAAPEFDLDSEAAIEELRFLLREAPPELVPTVLKALRTFIEGVEPLIKKEEG